MKQIIDYPKILRIEIERAPCAFVSGTQRRSPGVRGPGESRYHGGSSDRASVWDRIRRYRRLNCPLNRPG
jgi:hypothetical protein